MRVHWFLFVILSSCSAIAPHPSAITSIRMERTTCFGTCPAYSVEVRSDGSVTYEGSAFVKAIGKRSARISIAAFRRIAAKSRQIHFFGLDDGYWVKQLPNGVESESDDPTTTTTIVAGKRQKTVKDYYGAPDGLIELEKLIDKECDTARWIKGKT